MTFSFNYIRTKLSHSAIGKNVIANVSKVFVIFIHQVLLVPLYLTYWGTELYSDWIILSAITSFFSMSDMGLNSVTSNQFCIKFAKKEYNECKSLIVNNYALLWSIALLFITLLIIYCLFIDISKSLGLVVLSRYEASYIAIILVGKIFLDMSSFIPDAIYNAKSLAFQATYINTLLRLAGSLVILFGILMKMPITEIVSISIIPSFIALAYKKQKAANMFKIGGIKFFNFELLKKIIRPSISYMSFPFGLALLYQGFTLVVNRFYGHEALVLFNTTRTMVNFIRNMGEAVTSGVRSEFSLAFGRNDYKRMSMIHKRSIIASLAISITCCLVLLVGGKWIYDIWTRGEIQFSLSLMLSFFIVIIFNTLSNTNITVLLATNSHTKIGIIYLFASIASLATAYAVSKLGILELTALSIVISDIITSFYSYRSAMKIIDNSSIL